MASEILKYLHLYHRKPNSCLRTCGFLGYSWNISIISNTNIKLKHVLCYYLFDAYTIVQYTGGICTACSSSNQSPVKYVEIRKLKSWLAAIQSNNFLYHIVHETLNPTINKQLSHKNWFGYGVRDFFLVYSALDSN